MATYKPYRKTSSGKEEIKIPYSVLSNPPAIPTSINGLTGGTLTSPITLTGGDSATAAKMILTANGQITDTGTSTLLGLSSGNLIVGHGSYPLKLRGKNARPTYNDSNVALQSDIPDVSGKQDKLTAGSNITISGNTISATVPTKTSQLTNDSGYATTSQIPTKTSQLTNDSGFLTSAPANYTQSSLAPSACTQNGFYYVSSGTNSLTDKDGNPFLQYHTEQDFRILTTAYSSSWLQQIATDFRSDHVYIRRCQNGTWYPWEEVAKTSDIPTFSLSGTTLYITL